MDKIELINNLKYMIAKENYGLVSLPLDIEGYTNNARSLVFINPDIVSIFALTEEYFHIKHHHSGRLIWTDNDERNPNEHEAWNSAINWLKKQWDIYVGTDNYYDFMISLEVPSTLEPNIKQEFGVIEYNFLKETHLN